MTIEKYDISQLVEIFEKLNSKRYGSDIPEDICGYVKPTEMTYYYNRDYLCLTPAKESDPERSPGGYKKLSVGPEGFFCTICSKNGIFSQDIHSVMDYLIGRLQERYPSTFFSTDYKFYLFVDGHNVPVVYLNDRGLLAMDYVYDMTGEELAGDSEEFCVFCLTCLLEYLNINEPNN